MPKTDKKPDEQSQILERALEILKQRGPMKAKKLATELGLRNARSLSMQFQWAHERVERVGNKWRAK